MKDNELSGAFGKYGGEEKCMQHFGVRELEGKNTTSEP
jgi:hypothetical protein